MTTITYANDMFPHNNVSIVLGRRLGITREGACLDIFLTRGLAIDCPVEMSLLIRTDGQMVEWAAEFAGNTNTYWHLAHTHNQPVTDAQRKSLAGIHFGTLMPFGLKGSLGRPACELAFAGLTHAQAETLGGVQAGSIVYNG